MRVRILLALVLLVVALAAPALAVIRHGLPWGFRGAPAVLIEVAGDVEIKGGARREARDATGIVAATPGLRLLPGDVVRVGRFSEARLRLQNADVALKDGARASVGEAKLALGRGMAEVIVPAGERGAQVDIDGAEPGKPDAQVSVQPGRALVSVDGKGSTVVVVKEGSAQATTALGVESAEPDQALIVGRGAPPKVAPAPTRVELAAECQGATKLVTGTAPIGTQVFLNGKLEYADANGQFTLPWPPGITEGILFARDPAGNVDRKLVVCAGE